MAGLLTLSGASKAGHHSCSAPSIAPESTEQGSVYFFKMLSSHPLSKIFFGHVSALTSQLEAVLGHFHADTEKKNAKEKPENNKSLPASICPLERRDVRDAKCCCWLGCVLYTTQLLGKSQNKAIDKAPNVPGFLMDLGNHQVVPKVFSIS